MLVRLRELEGVKGGSNQVADVLIAETAMRRNAVLVSSDKKLRALASEFGIEVMSPEAFARRWAVFNLLQAGRSFRFWFVAHHNTAWPVRVSA